MRKMSDCRYFHKNSKLAFFISIFAEDYLSLCKISCNYLLELTRKSRNKYLERNDLNVLFDLACKQFCRVFLYFLIFCQILTESCQHWHSMVASIVSVLTGFCQDLAENYDLQENPYVPLTKLDLEYWSTAQIGPTRSFTVVSNVNNFQF